MGVNRQVTPKIGGEDMHLFLVILKQSYEDDEIGNVVAKDEEEIKQRVIDSFIEGGQTPEEAKEHVEENVTLEIRLCDEVEGYTVILEKKE